MPMCREYADRLCSEHTAPNVCKDDAKQAGCWAGRAHAWELLSDSEASKLPERCCPTEDYSETLPHADTFGRQKHDCLRCAG